MRHFSNHKATPENHFPFSPFLASLASDGIRLTVHDYEQLTVILQTRCNWSVDRLKNVLTTLLAKNEDQQEIILRRFDRFFAKEIEADNRQLAIDIRQVINDLKAIQPQPRHEKALGQYVLYHDILKCTEPDRILYLAIRQAVFLDVFEEPVGELLLKNQRVRLIVFDHRTEEIIQWIP